MNETLMNIHNRRSVRKFKNEQIKDEELNAILEAGQYAPSAMNQQSWHFTVIRNNELLKRLNDICVKILIGSHNKSFEARAKGVGKGKINITYGAPTVIVVSGDENAISPQIDGCLAIENMLLAAESFKIGTCFIYGLNHMFATEEGKAFLMQEGIIPENYKIVGTCLFGYSLNENLEPVPRKQDNVTIIE